MSRFIPHLTPRRAVFTALGAAAALASVALLGSPAVANASEPAVEAPQLTVYYSFRDLSTERGTRALYLRIVSAARGVCPSYDSRDLDAFSYSRECQRRAVARAVRQIGNSHLAAVHQRALGAAG